MRKHSKWLTETLIINEKQTKKHRKSKNDNQTVGLTGNKIKSKKKCKPKNDKQTKRTVIETKITKKKY